METAGFAEWIIKMPKEDIEKELLKPKYHVRLLGESIDWDANPIQALVISMDWDEKQLSRAHDIFEEYDKKLSAKQTINWVEFEHKLRDEFGIGYQTVKSIVVAFFKKGQWARVCEGYAKSADCVEFHCITKSE